jgi:hypothetical protein
MLEENSTSAEDSRARLPDINTAVHERKPKFSFYVAVVFVLLFVGWCIFYFFHWYYHMGDTRILYQRFAAVVGIPLAMCAAFVVVAILEQTSGPIEVSAPGFSIKGAAGQVLFWLLVFLAIVHAIEVLWPLTSAG